MSTQLIRFCVLVGICISAVQIWAQNLAPNPGFEDNIACPMDWNGPGEPLECLPWQPGSLGSCDYFNRCCGSCSVWIPDNSFGSQEAAGGDAYTGLFACAQYNPEYNYR